MIGKLLRIIKNNSVITTPTKVKNDNLSFLFDFRNKYFPKLIHMIKKGPNINNIPMPSIPLANAFLGNKIESVNMTKNIIMY